MRPRPLRPGPVPPSRQRASGMVLVVAIVLLLLAGLLTLFAVRIGAFEQRSTGNDLRAKLVGEVAEAGLAQGFEYLYRQHREMLKDPSLWERCDAGDDSSAVRTRSVTGPFASAERRRSKASRDSGIPQLRFVLSNATEPN